VTFEFRLPDLGEGIQEAELLQWKVALGEHVAAFQPLCDVESAKAAVELTAPVAGQVRELCVAAGAIARRGDLLVVLDTDADGDSQREAAGDEWFGIVGRAPAAVTAPAPTEGSFVRAAPFVRKLARDLGVNLADIHGSGPQGRVRASDVQAYAQHPTREERVPLRGLRREIAAHMVAAVRNAPQVTSMDLLDATELVRARDVLGATAAADGVKLNYLPFFVRAAIEALRAVPEANAIVEDDAIVLKHDYNIGIATAVPGGLIVPVVKHADGLSLLDIAREIERLVLAARERRSTPADLAEGTFTITSFGGLPGSPMFATPILNYPQVAILGIGRIDLQPRVVDGQVVPRQCVGISFTFDHRVLDGEGAGRFMSAFKHFVEQPLALLLRLR
jgi:pyruvate dehydrogenase E2 component (dihydrolipoyllysine-residue acetyltransferase)